MDDNQPVDPEALNLSRAIALKESSGNPNAIGDNGTAAGLGQWSNQVAGKPQPLAQGEIPANFKSYAEKYGTNPNDFSQINQEKTLYAEVAYKKNVLGWSPAQIAASHNAGDAKAADGSWQQNVGTTTLNGKPIAYDTPKYVAEVKNYYDQLSGQQDSSSGGFPSTKLKDIPSQPSQADSTDSLGSELTNRGQDAAQALGLAGQGIGEMTSGNIGRGLFDVGSGALQTGGAIAGGVGDVAGKVLGLIPGVKQAEGVIGQGVGALANTAPGKAVVGAAQDFSQEHPEIAKDIGSAFNIGGLIAGGAGAKVGKDALMSSLGKDALGDTIAAISPEIKAGTAKGAANVSQMGTVKSGIFGTIRRAEDPQMREAAQVIQDNVPSFDKLGTNSEKLDVINDVAIPNEAEGLRTALTSSPVQNIITPEIYDGFKSSIEKSIEESPSLIGDSGEYAKRFLGIFEKNLPQGRDITAEDILNARQALDQAAKSAKPKVFDAGRVNAYSDGLDAVRTAANELTAQLAPDDVNVQASLRRQSLLYKAAKNLSVKADKEVGTNRFSRFAKRHPRTTGLIKTAGQAALTGAGIRGAEELF